MVSVAPVNVVPYVDKSKSNVPGIVSFDVNKQRHIRCEFCLKFQHILKQHVPNKVPPIATIQGTRFYSRILSEHLETLYHKECAKAHRISLTESTEVAPMEMAVSKANKSQIDHIGKLMIQVYLDAKRLNLPPHSWPSRYVVGEASHAYDSINCNQSKSIIPYDINLQYVNKPGHLNLMSTIVQSYREEFLRKIHDCVAVSLRIDGSIDFTHVDKIYVMAKLIKLDGTSELVFIGISEQTQRKSTGLMAAVKGAIEVSFDDLKILFRKVSSICTDGTNLNSGEKSGLWVLVEKEIQSTGSQIPLIKIWCAAHRAELAWKNISSSVAEVSKVLGILSKISTYSAVRS